MFPVAHVDVFVLSRVFFNSHIPGWGLCTYIVKANDDLRQVRESD